MYIYIYRFLYIYDMIYEQISYTPNTVVSQYMWGIQADLCFSLVLFPYTRTCMCICCLFLFVSPSFSVSCLSFNLSFAMALLEVLLPVRSCTTLELGQHQIRADKTHPDMASTASGSMTELLESCLGFRYWVGYFRGYSGSEGQGSGFPASASGSANLRKTHACLLW